MKITFEKNAIHKLCKDILYNSAGQALIRIYETPNLIVKAFLLVSVVVSSGLCSYLIIRSFINYFSYEVITVTRTIFETPTLFPRIKICNNSPFTTEFAYEFIKNISNFISPHKNMFDINQEKLLNASELEKTFRSILDISIARINSKNFSDSDRKKLGHNIEDILFKCHFNLIECKASDFIWEFDRLRGNCYVFNSGFNSNRELLKSNIAGSFYGLRVSFYVHANEKLIPFNTLYNTFDSQVIIENNSHLNEFTLDGIRLPGGFETNINVERVLKYNLPKPYSNCDLGIDTPEGSFNSELYNLFSYSDHEYTQQICLEQCFQKELAKKCNCSSPYHLSLFNLEPYETIEQIKCHWNVFENIYISGDYIRNTCLPLCPLECNKTEFKYLISMNQLNGYRFLGFILRNKNLSSDFINESMINMETATKSFVSVNIYYDSLSYILSIESPKMSIVSLLADIGGNLGLLMGVSAFSIYEIIEVFIEICFIKKALQTTKVQGFNEKT